MASRIARLIPPVLLAGALAGCSGIKEVPYDHGGSAPVKTIGLLPPAMSTKRPAVVLASTVGNSFGLVGALVNGAMRSAREDRMEALFTAQHYDVNAEFENDLQATLEAHGYKVVRVAATRQKTDFLEQYPSAAGTEIDAYLDVADVQYGFLSAGMGSSNPYRPTIDFKCKLVRASDKSLLMQEEIAYNPLNAKDGKVTLPPDPAYAFVDDDTLNADPPKTREAFDTALRQSTDAVGNLLR
ncbi:MAG TPA: hypothetical protein VM689_17645 [Aliidongia sp.]|nr:hypothetical protein [Aliidongia sp.]